ncbi:MAG: Cell shape determining protein, MreB/Mrl family [Candidatus Roizmanbacteria bacterium GW2011_GWC2_37_13]|uniref:Cell shape determining protein, MreB/Mrl family n=1 Tax=Candidatus Roizmanbacteria bacterium GW2011_GWC2_37_13 TaxID=1618486 RepID=A0A0G0JBZ8_9BACT|nr:MAG: Cell shape determining protein, MreB/Mrl family [Candidatus Roizmanbacteria bacterium GW2011_GWC1_37_12]KKQ25686.1 MAG: Cell shape determining protein, MreB/Mrl family [Candidatus Roizmanbacteria bacterium GW2011_GWC2_37_13]
MINFTSWLSKIKLPFFSNFEVYFDLGTSVTKIAIKDKGIILREPTFLGFNSRINQYLFFGNEAKSIIGKTPDFIKIVRPVIAGVISDFDAEVSLINKYLERSIYLYLTNKMIKPVMVGVTIVPTIATEIEQKAAQEVLYKAGLSQVFLIEKPLATAAGCNLNIFSHQPTLVADLGGGLIELSIIGSGGIISQKTLKNAGDNMNRLIYNYVYLKYGVILGEATCEGLKTDLLNFENSEKTVTIRGKSLETGLPKSVRVKSSDIKEALLTNFNQITDAIKELIESSPPEIVDEVMKRGIILTGGLSRIGGLDKFFRDEIKIDVITSKDYQYATINGLIKLANHKEELSKLIIR